MLIDINQIARLGMTVDRELALGGLSGESEDLISAGPAHVKGLLVRGRRGVEFQGGLESPVTLRCVRCLEEFVSRVALEFHLEFVSAARADGPPRSGAGRNGRGEHRMKERDCDLYPVTEGKVDLVEVAREQIFLSLPVKPLCTEECAGLCPGCGANRNREQCSCSARELPEPGANNLQNILIHPRRSG